MESHLILSKPVISKSKSFSKLFAANYSKSNTDPLVTIQSLEEIWDNSLLIKQSNDEAAILILTKEYTLYIFH